MTTINETAVHRNGTMESRDHSKNAASPKSLMSRINILSLMVLLFGVMFIASCGGGGGAGIKKNEFIGNLPQIINTYKIEESALKEKRKSAAGDKKASEKASQALKNLESKFEENIKALSAQIAGKDIPFTMSEEFEKLNFEVNSVKIQSANSSGFTMVAPVVAKNDFTLRFNDENRGEYQSICYRAVAKDGSTIGKSTFDIAASPQWGQTKSFTKGQSLRPNGEDAMLYLMISRNLKAWVDFASIEFVTSKEYIEIEVAQ